jgi:hypothetical protein
MKLEDPEKTTDLPQDSDKPNGLIDIGIMIDIKVGVTNVLISGTGRFASVLLWFSYSQNLLK